MDIIEELEGLAEAWRDDASNCRESGDNARAQVYDECADEADALRKRLAKEATPKLSDNRRLTESEIRLELSQRPNNSEGI